MTGLSDKERDIRIAVASRIWGMAVGMLGICIPLSAVTDSGPIIPIAVITGAAVGTGAVWKSSEDKSQTRSLAPTQIDALEERIANLETIAGIDELDVQKRIAKLESDNKVE